MKKQKVVKGYKAYNPDMTCKGFKFEEGKTYETDEAKCCESGFHLCLNPLDTLNYYDITNCVFTEAEALGKIDTHKDDTKIATTKIKIGAKLSLKDFCQASFDFLWKECSKKKIFTGKSQASSGNGTKQASSGNGTKQASSGYHTQQASSGDHTQQASSGDHTQQASSGNGTKQASSGDYTQMIINGKNSVAVAAGNDCIAKGKMGNWICLAEWKNINNVYTLVCVKAIQIDGKIIKEDIFYKLENGNFIEVK